MQGAQRGRTDRWLVAAVAGMGAVVLTTAVLIGVRWLRQTAAAQPSGAQLVYLGSEDGATLDLYLADAAGGRVQRITEGPEYEFAAAWSPDGEMLAAVRAPAQGSLDAVGRESGLFLLTWVRGAPREQMLISADEAGLGPIAWSPDGRQVAMIGSPLSFGAETWPEPSLTLVDVGSGAVRQYPVGPLPDMSGPSLITTPPGWTADGAALVFQGYGMRSPDATEGTVVAPVRFDLATESLTTLAASGQNVALSSGGLVAYLSTPPDEPRLWLVDSGGGEPTALSEPFSEEWWSFGLAWSPDGSRLASVEGDGERSALFIRSPGQEPLSEYATPYQGRHVAALPAWSPDGRYVSYTLVTDMSGDLPASSVIVVDTADGTVTPWAEQAGTFVGFTIWRPGGH